MGDTRVQCRVAATAGAGGITYLRGSQSASVHVSYKETYLDTQEDIRTAANVGDYEKTLLAALNVYIQRLAWLDSGSRKVRVLRFANVCVSADVRQMHVQYFGVITEPTVAILVDVTHRHVDELKV